MSVRLVTLVVMLALALPASAQDLETRGTKFDDLAVQIERCQVELEFGFRECLAKVEAKRRDIIRKGRLSALL
jgi:hypothetical protein